MFCHKKLWVSELLPVQIFPNFRRERVFAQSYKWILNLQSCNGIMSRNSIIQELQLLHMWAEPTHSLLLKCQQWVPIKNVTIKLRLKKGRKSFLNVFHVHTSLFSSSRFNHTFPCCHSSVFVVSPLPGPESQSYQAETGTKTAVPRSILPPAPLSPHTNL